VQEGRRGGGRASFDPGVIAEVAPVPIGETQVREVLVVVNVPLLQQVYHAQQGASFADLSRDLDRIVIHEVYGHAVPYLQVGSLAGRCADPAPGEAATEACAIRRENAVREELGLGLRVDAGLGGLTLIGRSAARWSTGAHR
jgi:hypothetical protein